MALKMEKGKKITEQAKPVPVDYSTHLEEHVSKPIVSMVSVEKKLAGQKTNGAVANTKTEHPGVITSVKKLMQLTVEGGRTLNLGNYESARIGVIITVPCEMDTLEESYEWATNWVSDKIQAVEKDVKGQG